MENINIEKINDYSNLSGEEIIDIANKKIDIDTEKFKKHNVIPLPWKIFNLDPDVTINSETSYIFSCISGILSTVFLFFYYLFFDSPDSFFLAIMSSFLIISFLVSSFISIKKEYSFKKEHIKNNSFRLLTSEEIVNIAKLHYDKRDKILKLLKSNYLVDKKEIDEIIEKENRNKYYLFQDIDQYYHESNKFKKEFYKKIKEHQSEAIKVILNPNFTNRMDFKVEYKIDNGPLKVKYVNAVNSEIKDYIENMCMESYNRKPDYMNIKSL